MPRIRDPCMGCGGSQASVLLLATPASWDPAQACGFLMLCQALGPLDPCVLGRPWNTGGTAGLEGPGWGAGPQLGPGQLCSFPTVPSRSL